MKQVMARICWYWTVMKIENGTSICLENGYRDVCRNFYHNLLPLKKLHINIQHIFIETLHYFTRKHYKSVGPLLKHRIHYNSIAFLNENTRNGNFFYYLMPLCGSDENKEILCLKFEVSMRSNIFWASNRSHMIQLRKWKSLYQLGPKIVYNYEIFTA